MRLERQSVGELIEIYVRAAERQAIADEVVNVAAGNSAADEIAMVHRELRDRPNDSIRELLQLLDHPTPNVRLWAAAHTLDIDTHRSVLALKALSELKGLTGFTARVTLEEWHAGRLRFS